MLRKFLFVGTVTGISVAIPVLYEKNPAFIESFLVSASPSPEATQPVGVRSTRMEPPPVERQSESIAGRSVRIQGDPRGHFIGEFRLNGLRMIAMVDTGATYVAINSSTARRLGIYLQPEDFRHVLQTANGQTRAAVAMIERLEIGRIDVTNVETLVLDDRSLSDILIGVNFLSRLKRYSVESGALVMEQ